MCDYSLQHVASRSAQVGDKLVSSRFDGTISRGFSAVGDPNVAVCLLPGTEIAFEGDVEFDGSFFRKKVGNTLARFRTVNLDQEHRHHDALEFANGHFVLLTQLAPGQVATVLQLPAGEKRADEQHEAEEQVQIREWPANLLV